MFATDALTSDFAVARLLRYGQWVLLGLLLGRLAVGLAFLQALIPAIGQTQRRQANHRAAVFEQSIVLLFAFTEGRGNNLARALVGNHLGFVGVTLLLARVVAALF